MIKSYQTKLFYTIVMIMLQKTMTYGQLTGYYGSLEAAFKEPQKVIYLYLHGVRDLPPSIKKFVNLKKLIIKYGRLQRLPVEIAELKKLDEITLYATRIKEGLPREIATLPQLKRISVELNSVRFPKELKERKGIKLEDQSSRMNTGIFAAIQQSNYSFLEIGIFRGYWYDLGHIGTDLAAWFLSWEKSLHKGVEGYKFGVGASLLALSVVYYRNTTGNKTSGFAFRPELTLGFAPVKLGLGYNFASRSLENINRGFFRLQLNLSILSKSRITYY